MSHSPTQSELVASQQSLIERSQALIDIGLQSLEQFSRLQLDTLRKSSDALLGQSKQLISVSSPNELLGRQSEFLSPQLESYSSYLHQLWRLSQDTQADIFRELEQSQSEWNKLLSSSLERYAGHSKGSELTVTAIRSAISAANSAFDQASKTARQVADIADASVAAATSATVRAASSATPAQRKKAA